MKDNKRISDILVVGFAMFAIYFGAGNLIFPSFIGFESGSDWLSGLSGLTLTGIALPILAIAAVANAGGTFEKLTRPINSWFHHVYNVLVMIGVGMLITIPRTGTVAYETGFRVVLPQVNESLLKPAAIILFFGLTFYFAADRSKIIDKIGKILTPILLLILGSFVVLAVANPIGTPVNTGITNPFYSAFSNAYQMGDVLTGLLTAVIFVQAFRAKGYEDNDSLLKVVFGACAVAFAGLFVIYGGLEYLGATGSGYFEAGTDKTVLLMGLIERLTGTAGMTALPIAVAVACLTTSVGLTSVVADYLNELTRGKLSYSHGVMFVSFIGVFQAMGGVERIIMIAGPIFMGIYPVSILLVVLGLLKKVLPNDGIWKGSVLLVVTVSLYDAFVVIGAIVGFKMPAFLTNLYQAILMASQGFAWVVPAIAGGLVGGLLYLKKTDDQDAEPLVQAQE